MSPQLTSTGRDNDPGAPPRKTRVASRDPLHDRKETHKRLAPKRVLAVDPGTAHCGVAQWDACSPTFANLVSSIELSPGALKVMFKEWDGRSRSNPGMEPKPDLVVIENFKLVKGKNFMGSDLQTPRLIGVLEYLCDEAQIPYVLQDPSEKIFAQAIMRRNGVNFVGSNQHKRDAEMHGWLYLLSWQEGIRKVKNPTHWSIAPGAGSRRGQQKADAIINEKSIG